MFTSRQNDTKWVVHWAEWVKMVKYVYIYHETNNLMIRLKLNFLDTRNFNSMFLISNSYKYSNKNTVCNRYSSTMLITG